MYPTASAAIVFAFTFFGALLGIRLRTTLPAHHLSAESKETVKVCIGLIATMTALILGLVTASAKSSFDRVDTAVKQTAIEIIALDRVLARYGPETAEIRAGLKRATGARIDMVWPQGSARPTDLDPLSPGAGAEGLAEAIRSLRAVDDSQRTLQARALDLAEALLQERWLVLTAVEPSVPVPFLVILLFWLTIIFVSFGLFAPSNATVLTVLFLGAMSVGGAVFLLLEMDVPFDGLIKVSGDPFRYAYARLNQ